MNDRRFHVAQVNVARALQPLEDPRMAGFVARLDEINALAERSPGFVWRLRDASGNATTVQAYDDPRMLVNLSVWESVEALESYAYRTPHVEVMRARRQWFELPSSAHLALWWIPAGRLPTVAEAKARLRWLARSGPTRAAFTFRSRFGAPAQAELDYDGKRFATAVGSPNGDAAAGTTFAYHQCGTLVWGSYEGPSIACGSFLAHATSDGVLDMRYQHVSRDGELKLGIGQTLPLWSDQDALRLYEAWRWVRGEGEREGESELVEL